MKFVNLVYRVSIYPYSPQLLAAPPALAFETVRGEEKIRPRGAGAEK